MTPMSLKDLGNMNYTVFTHRQDYEESLVCEAVNRGWGLDLSVNKTMTSSQETNCRCVTMATGGQYSNGGAGPVLLYFISFPMCCIML